MEVTLLEDKLLNLTRSRCIYAIQSIHGTTVVICTVRLFTWEKAFLRWCVKSILGVAYQTPSLIWNSLSKKKHSFLYVPCIQSSKDHPSVVVLSYSALYFFLSRLRVKPYDDFMTYQQLYFMIQMSGRYWTTSFDQVVLKCLISFKKKIPKTIPLCSLPIWYLSHHEQLNQQCIF